MKRRAFVQNSVLGLAGGLILPSALMGCKKPLGNFPEGFRVIVVGAGAAGLYAAKKMKEHGADITILEATGRLGGRVGKLDGFADFGIDLGAEWIHGQRALTKDLAEGANFSIFEDQSESDYWINGNLTTNASNSQLNELNAILEGEQNYTGADVSLREHASQLGLPASYDGLLEAMAGEYGTRSSLLSLKYTPQEFENWSSGGKDFKYARTQFDLINEVVAASVVDDIIFNSPVTGIDYAGGTVSVTTASNTVYEADRVLVTVPLGVLKAGLINFNPNLPTDKLDAIQSVGFDAGMKIFLKFSQNFWNGRSVGGASVCPAYYDVGYGKTGNDHVLGAFLMGEKAEYLSSLGQNAIQPLLAELDDIFNGQATANFVDSHIMDWGQEPYVRGAYSFSSLGIGNKRNALATSVNDRLFFAGEATHTDGHFQTVHGALETGEREFEKILASV
jgi:lysine-specific histone demethylase 1B